MEKEYWYYEYIIKVWNDIDDKEEVRSGVVPAENAVKALDELQSYYGDCIEDVMTLKPILDGKVFDFQFVTNEFNTSFDFDINPKK